MKRITQNHTLRFGEPQDGTAAAGDPLDTNVNDIDTSRPRLPAATYELRVKSATREPTKDQSGERLTLVFETIAQHTSTDREPIAPGLVIYHYLGITEKPARPSLDGKKTLLPLTLGDIAKGIAGVSKSAGLNCSARSVMNNPSQLVGKTVHAKVKINKETSEYPESNGIGEFVVVK